jgi:hypothetical protein
MPMVKSVFISHSSLDNNFVRKLARDLAAHNIKPWVDELDTLPGDSIFQKVSEAMEKTDFTIVVLSKSSVKSPWVNREIAAEISRNAETGRALIPVRIDSVQVPTLLRDTVYVDFAKDTYKQGLRKLIRAIHSGSLTEHTRSTTQPIAEIYATGAKLEDDGHGEPETSDNLVQDDERLDPDFFLIGGAQSHYRTCKISNTISDMFSPIVFDPKFNGYVPTPQFGDTKSAISFECDVYSHQVPKANFDHFLETIDQIVTKIAPEARIWDRRVPLYWSFSREQEMDYGVGAENALLAVHQKKRGVLACAIHFGRFNVYKPTGLLLFYADIRPEHSLQDSLYLDACWMRMMLSTFPLDTKWIKEVFETFRKINDSYNANTTISDVMMEQVSTAEWTMVRRSPIKSSIMGFMGRERGSYPEYDQPLGLVVDMMPFRNVEMVKYEEHTWNFGFYDDLYKESPAKSLQELPVSVTNPVPHWQGVQSGLGSFRRLRTRQMVVGATAGSGRIMSVVSGHSTGLLGGFSVS